jgi:putative bacteriocin precursor
MKKLGKKSRMEQGTFVAYACGNCNCRNVCITCNNCTTSTPTATGAYSTQVVNTNKIFRQAAGISIL